MITDESSLISIKGAQSAYIDLASGARAHYLVAGPENGAPVILLHGGLPGSSGAAGWRFMLPALADAGFRVYAPDRPGFGNADARVEHHPVEGHLSWIAFLSELADALGIDRFSLAGNSQGAQCAANFAVTHPERVDKLALIATSGFNGALEIPEEQLTKGIPFPVWQGTKESMGEMMESIIHRGAAVTDEVLSMRTKAAEVQREAYTAAAKWNRATAADPEKRHILSLTGKLDALSLPVIYLYGRQDVLGPVENAYLQEDRLPNVQVFYPDDCGHQGQTDQPEMFNQVFTEFFRDGKVTTKTAEWAGVSDRRPVLSHLVHD